jgi:hypothetical protein
MKVALILLGLTTTSILWAKTNFDLFLGAQGRSAPSIGAEVYAESGYNLVWWGEKKQKKDVFYGLIRPSLALSSSGVINSGKAEIEFFPVSFIGFAAGRQLIHSNYEFPFFNCDEVVCKGMYERNFVEAKMALGAKRWVVVAHYKVDVLEAPRDNLMMADWRHVIIGNPGREIQIEKKLILAKAFGNELAGIMIENVQFQGSRERKESFAGIYQVRHNDTNYMVGLGAYHTSQEPMGAIIYFRINHVSIPSLKLF